MYQSRALAGDPSIILADEPTGALDSRTGKEVLGFLKQLHNEGNTIVLITHDNTIAAQAERVIRVQDGKVVYDGEPDITKFATVAHAGDDDGTDSTDSTEPSNDKSTFSDEEGKRGGEDE